jgi:hypothetical protein
MANEHHRSEEIETYAGGEIRSRHGIVNRWLMGLYAVLFLWSIYYVIGPFDGWRPTLVFWGWGGLGPGLSSKGVEQGVEGLEVIGVIALSIVLISIVGFFAWFVILVRKK